jgi:hypothetical protein
MCRPKRLDEISQQATRLVSEYFAGVSERGVVAQNYAGKTTSELDAQLQSEGVPSIN